MSRKLLPVLTIFVLAVTAGAYLFAGCGGGKQDEGFKYTVEQTGEGDKPGKIVVEGGEGGDATLETSETVPTEQDLGVPIYPGSEYVPGSGQALKASRGEGQLFLTGAEFTTSDAFEQVTAFYEEKLKQPPSQAEGTVADWIFKDEAGQIYLVTVEAIEGKVKITIIKTSSEPVTAQ